jgi:hypothetical protein
MFLRNAGIYLRFYAASQPRTTLSYLYFTNFIALSLRQKPSVQQAQGRSLTGGNKFVSVMILITQDGVLGVPRVLDVAYVMDTVLLSRLGRVN